MKQQPVTYFGVKTGHPEHGFDWKQDPSVKKLLDVVVYILANEYVRAVKENPELFGEKKEIASAASRPRNDDGVDSRSPLSRGQVSRE